MAKTNFTKVEEALNEGLLKMNISGLLDKAPAVSGEGTPPISRKEAAARREILAALRFDVKHSKAAEFFAAGGMTRPELKALLDNPLDITAEGWSKLAAFREKTEAYRKEVLAKLPNDANEKLVEEQRKKHINKRYNTKEQWLPLH